MKFVFLTFFKLKALQEEKKHVISSSYLKTETNSFFDLCHRMTAALNNGGGES